MSEDDAFTGNCPTCGQVYWTAEVERLRAALLEIAAAIPNHGRNDSNILARRVMIARDALQRMKA